LFFKSQNQKKKYENNDEKLIVKIGGHVFVKRGDTSAGLAELIVLIPKQPPKT
jgi:hypothetical protein